MHLFVYSGLLSTLKKWLGPLKNLFLKTQKWKLCYGMDGLARPWLVCNSFKTSKTEDWLIKSLMFLRCLGATFVYFWVVVDFISTVLCCLGLFLVVALSGCLGVQNEVLLYVVQVCAQCCHWLYKESFLSLAICWVCHIIPYKTAKWHKHHRFRYRCNLCLIIIRIFLTSVFDVDKKSNFFKMWSSVAMTSIWRIKEKKTCTVLNSECNCTVIMFR